MEKNYQIWDSGWVGIAFCVEAAGGGEVEEERGGGGGGGGGGRGGGGRGGLQPGALQLQLRSWGTAGAPDPPPTSLMPLQK